MQVRHLVAAIGLCLAQAAAAQSLTVWPSTVIAPRGSYQTVSAIVNGVNDKTVTWSTDCGTIKGTNPSTANEPSTIGLYDTTAETCHLTASSNAHPATVATSTITFTASPTPVTTHPRFIFTQASLATLRAKGVDSNPIYAAIKSWVDGQYFTPDSSIWTYSTWNGSACTGGSGPSTSQAGNNRENDAYWMSIIATISNDSTRRNTYGCAARDIYMANVGYALADQINLTQGNRWSDGSTSFIFAADWLMGGNYFSSADMTNVRAFLYKYAQDQVSAGATDGVRALIGSYNDPAQFVTTSNLAATGERATVNNYSRSRDLLLMGIGLMFNDDTTDDPPLTNTCSATRYQICSDGTAGSLHAYWTYDWGGMLYKEWANVEDAGITFPAYNAAFGLSSIPNCPSQGGPAVISCFGGSRGGESSEGVFYGYSLQRLRWMFNALHTAGMDDPLSQKRQDGTSVAAPQISYNTSSMWDLRYLADYTQLAGRSGDANVFQRMTILTNGDTNTYYTEPLLYNYDAAMMTFDYYTGRTDRKNALEWLILNLAWGGADGTQGGCVGGNCGWMNEASTSHAVDSAVELFLSLPAANPVTTSPPTDPRSSFPTDWYNAGNKHILVRDGTWGDLTGTEFNYYCTDTRVDHENQYCGGFHVYSNGEYITKGRMIFTNYHYEEASALDQNIESIINAPTSTECRTSDCQQFGAALHGGQWFHDYQYGINVLYHSELPAYVAAIADNTGSYNSDFAPYYSDYMGVTQSSRSLIYLRSAHQIITFDRGATGSNAWDKSINMVATGNPTITGGQACWLTRSTTQKACWTTLTPSVTPSILQYTDGDATNDWEIWGRLTADAGSVTAAQFLHVLEWGTSTLTPATKTAVNSTSGNTFNGVKMGSNLVMFMHNWPASFSGVTYPASGATTHYVADLAPGTSYPITGTGAPASATTDTAGVLTFSATGTGNISIGSPTASAPTFSPVGGSYVGTQSVTLSTSSVGAILCWNTTGSPATNGTTGCPAGSTLYTGPISVPSSETIYAVAGGTGFADSSVASAGYTITAPHLPISWGIGISIGVGIQQQ